MKHHRLIMWVQLQNNLSICYPAVCNTVHKKNPKRWDLLLILVVKQWNASGCLPLGVTRFISDLLRVWNIERVQHESNTTSYFLQIILIYISQSSMLFLCLCEFLYCAQNKIILQSDFKLKAMDTCSVRTSKKGCNCFVYTIFNIYHFWCNSVLFICPSFLLRTYKTSIRFDRSMFLWRISTFYF